MSASRIIKMYRPKVISWLWLLALHAAIRGAEKWQERSRARATRTDLVLKSSDNRWLSFWSKSVEAEHDG